MEVLQCVSMWNHPQLKKCVKGKEERETNYIKQKQSRKTKKEEQVLLRVLYMVVVYCMEVWLLISADNGGDREWVRKGVGVLKRQCSTVGEGSAVVDEAVVVAEALEDSRVDEASGAEPSAAEVDAGDVTAGEAHVHDLNGVGGYAAREWRRGALVDHYISLGTFLSPYSVRFYQRYRKHVKTNKQQKRPKGEATYSEFHSTQHAIAVTRINLTLSNKLLTMATTITTKGMSVRVSRQNTLFCLEVLICAVRQIKHPDEERGRCMLESLVTKK